MIVDLGAPTRLFLGSLVTHTQQHNPLPSFETVKLKLALEEITIFKVMPSMMKPLLFIFIWMVKGLIGACLNALESKPINFL